MKRILVVGAGLIGSRHVEAVLAHSECELVGVVEPNADLHSDPEIHYFEDMGNVDLPVDGAIIATPTDLHHTHGIEAAKRGWHLLIEKPVASSPAEAADLVEAVREAGVQCLVGHHRRYHPSIRKLRKIVQSGEIGATVTSTLVWAVRKPDDYFNTQWRKAGGSPVMINLVHDIDLLRFVLGEITDICGFSSDKERQGGRPESGAIALRFLSGACGTISFADTTPSPWGFEAGTAENPNIAATRQDMWWITGTKGGISFPSMTLWSGAEDWSQAAKPSKLQIETAVPLDEQLSHFLQVMDGQTHPLIGPDDAAETLRVACQIERLLAVS